MRHSPWTPLTLTVLIATSIATSPNPASAQTFLIDFDTDPSGNPIADGTVLTHVYASMGITLQHVGPGNACGDQVIARTYAGGDFGSPPNLVTTCPPEIATDISEDSFGMVGVILDSPATGVCIDVRPDNPGSADHWGVLRAYDSGGNLIDQATSSPGVIETICVNGSVITSAHFSGEGGRFARFDNLGLTYSAGPVPDIQYLPGTANLPGLGGTTWKTDLNLHNRGGFEMQATVALLERDQGNSAPAEAVFSAAPGESLHWDNVLDAVFNYSGAATLRVTASGGSLVASSRTYNDDPAGTYGQYIAGAAIGDAIAPGRTGWLIGLFESMDPDLGKRTNLGLISASPFAITVEVELFAVNGSYRGMLTYTLAPYESIQISRIFTDVTIYDIEGGYITVSSPTAQAQFFAYASVVDNRSGDGIYVPAR